MNKTIALTSDWFWSDSYNTATSSTSLGEFLVLAIMPAVLFLIFWFFE